MNLLLKFVTYVLVTALQCTGVTSALASSWTIAHGESGDQTRMERTPQDSDPAIRSARAVHVSKHGATHPAALAEQTSLMTVVPVFALALSDPRPRTQLIHLALLADRAPPLA